MMDVSVTVRRLRVSADVSDDASDDVFDDASDDVLVHERAVSATLLEFANVGDVPTLDTRLPGTTVPAD